MMQPRSLPVTADENNQITQAKQTGLLRSNNKMKDLMRLTYIM